MAEGKILFYNPDLGSQQLPHHGTNREPTDLQDAVQLNRNGLAGVEMRLMEIIQALSRVGLGSLAVEISQEAENIQYYREMMDRAIRKDLDEKVKNASGNTKAVVEAALAGVQLGKDRP